MFSRKDAIKYSRDFLNACSYLPIKINKAVLFGSTVTSKSKEDSDIDVALFSDDFGDNILKNIDLIGKVAIKFPDIDVHTFSSKSYKTSSLMIEEIKRTGLNLL